MKKSTPSACDGTQRWVVRFNRKGITVKPYTRVRNMYAERTGVRAKNHWYSNSRQDPDPSVEGKQYIVWAKDELDAYAEAMKMKRGEHAASGFWDVDIFA
jgi:hypothetical protein